ncbi:MAG: filamentous hemagglutinin N-terminal domain-containing protein [Burkholderiaceae bacterium]|nr:filamentous hemagglutinin N-terminal domain-containing protein [Burkholderiaceae bacterium]
MKLRRVKWIHQTLMPRSIGRRRRSLVQLACACAALELSLSGAVAQVHPGLPNACPGSGTVCGGKPFDWLKTSSKLTYGSSFLSINQNASTAIFNWQSFNISAGNQVQFVQPVGSSVALNRIYDPNQTFIDGTLITRSLVNGKLVPNAGQVYLLNPNGILFGANSIVDVGGLIASSLNLTSVNQNADARITNGLLSDPVATNPVFAQDPAFAPSNGSTPGPIQVMSGAKIHAAGRDSSGAVVSAGRVFLFAPDVENAGDIQVDGGGQVIMGAGTKVYLGSSSDVSLRGLLVEVDGGVKVGNSGSIEVPHGNVTLIGAAVNQSGRINATSALDANGSIYLIAQQADGSQGPGGFVPPPGSLPFSATAMGPVTLAPGSQTIVSTDLNGATGPLNDTTAAQTVSTIDIVGSRVDIGGAGTPGETVVQAHGGNITVTARQDLSTPWYGDTLTSALLATARPGADIHVGADALIDVSGLQNVSVSGDRNFVFIDRLTSTNLADAPLQRDGFLLGKSVWLNLADAPSWIDVSNLQSAVAGTQAERNSVGGTIALRAEGSVVLDPSSVLNVSGGSVHYTPGLGRTSLLIAASGQTVDISNASADTPYIAFADQGTRTYLDPRTGIDQTVSWQTPHYSSVGGFVEGKDAGTLEIYSPQASLGGTILGRTTVGPSQRTIGSTESTTTAPFGGLLRLNGDNPLSLDTEAYFSRPNILFGNGVSAAYSQLTPAQQAQTVALDTAKLVAEGMDRFQLTSDGTIQVLPGSTVNLGPGGQLTARANSILVDSSISAPGGTVALSERPITAPGPSIALTPAAVRDNLNLVTDPALRGVVDLAPGVKIDVAGTWTNDSLAPAVPAPTTPVVLNGGSISLSGRAVDVQNASFDVSAGAWLTASGTFSGGQGGTLSMTGVYQDPNSTAIAPPDTGSIVLGSNFAQRVAGFGVTAGGTLALSAPTIEIGATGAPSNSTTLNIDPAIGNRGFQSFQFKGFDLTDLLPGTTFDPVVLQFSFNPLMRIAGSANSLASVSIPTQLALPAFAPASSIALSAANAASGEVSIGAGASINAGTQGSIKLTGGDSIVDAGSLKAAAGSVALALAPAPGAQSVALLDSRVIDITAGATVDVSGISLGAPNARGLRTGSVLDAGMVTISAQLGSVQDQAGSHILARGASDTLDLSGPGAVPTPTLVASKGGLVEVSADMSLLLSGSFDAAGGSSSVRGGSLSVELNQPLVNLSTPPAVVGLYQQPRVLSIGPAPAAIPLSTTGVDLTAYAGVGSLSGVSIGNASFDQVWLQSPGQISLASGSSLSTRTALVLAAPAIAVAPGASTGATSVRSNYVALLNPVPNTASPPTASGGTGSLDVTADQIDLLGDVALAGVGTALFDATGEIRGIGQSSGTGPRSAGSLGFGGNLTLRTGQLVAATQSDFSFISTAAASDTANGRLTVESNGSGAPPDLSAGGSLVFDVGDFVSSGRISAPQGSVTIDATRSVTLQSGSQISVQGDATVPYGTVVNGIQWTYGVPPSQAVQLAPFTIASVTTGATVPAKGISIASPVLDVQPGSVLNLRGGGDVLGSYFIPGPGGTYNVSLNFPNTLAPTQRNSLFAIVPSLGKGYAPYDPQIFSDLTLNPGAAAQLASLFDFGQTITIGRGGPIPAGTYTVLPPAYAQLPGAFAVEAASGYQDISPSASQAMPDGTTIVAGRLGFASAGTVDSRWSGFRIFPSAQFNQLSELHYFLGSQYFTADATAFGQALPRVAADAGSLSLDAGSMRFAGTIEAAPATGGRGADIAIADPQISVVDTPPAQDQPSSNISLGANALNQLGAETLVLGATEQRQSGSVTLGQAVSLGGSVSVSGTAQSVVIDSKTPLSAGEIVLAGSSVSVAPGASLVATADSIPQTNAVTVTGDGAALYVGNTATLPLWTRSGASAPGAATAGSLAIAANAHISGRSVVFDSTLAQSYDPTFTLAASNVELSAPQLNLGTIPSGTPGVELTASLQQQLSVAQDVTLAAAGGFGLYGNATLGSVSQSGAPVTQQLTFVGPGFSGYGGASSMVTINAGHVILDNSAGYAYTAGATGTGSLQVHSIVAAASTGGVEVKGLVSFGGFQNLAIHADAGAPVSAPASSNGQLRFDGGVGQAAGLTVTNPNATLTIDATSVTALRGVSGSIGVSGPLAITGNTAAALPVTGELGASLSIQAGSVDLSGRIDLPSGVVQIAATGSTATDGVTLEPGSVIRVAGSTQQFASTTADASAGSIALSSSGGSIQQLTGSTLDIGGAGAQGDAGTLTASAPSGTVTLGGTLLAAPGTQARGAQVSIDAGQLGTVSGLISAISANDGGNADSVSLRARNGNIVLAPTDVLTANSITLDADGGGGPTDGSISIGGKLDASGTTGGRIALYANDQVVLNSGAVLDAHATAAGSDGGQVTISSRVTSSASAPATRDAIVLNAGSQINVAAGAGGTGGTVWLRTRPTLMTAPTDIEITAPTAGVSSVVSGARQTVVEGVLVDPHVGSLTINAAYLASAQSTLAGYMSAANRSSIAAQLGETGDPTFSLRPGLEVQATGDITVASPIDFSTGLVSPVSGVGTFAWRYGGSTLATSSPGALTLRAGGNLNIDANVTDGFASVVDSSGTTVTAPFSTGESWRYTMTAGADLTAANPSTTITGVAANLTIGTATASSPVIIRTGTGSIFLNASQDVVLDNGAGQQGNNVYTGGVKNIPGATFPDFGLGPTYEPMPTRWGGDLVVRAGRDVLGTDPGGANQTGSLDSVNDWLYSSGGIDPSTYPTAVWVNFDAFQQGFGALGGGNLSIDAGRDIVRAGAVVPSVGFYLNGTARWFNSGSLNVTAGGNIQQGLFYDESGPAQLRGGALIPTDSTNKVVLSSPASAVLLAQGDSTLTVQSRLSADFAAPFNPTASPDSQTAFLSGLFFTYGNATSFSARSAAGDLNFDARQGAT